MKLKKFIGLAAGLLTLLPLAHANNTTVSLGTIGVITGFGSASDNNLIYVANATDSDCTQTQTYAAVCGGGISISSWSITFDYTSLVNQVQMVQTPITFSGGWDITPSNDPIANPLYGALPYSDATNGIACCLNIITKVVFTATLPGSFTIYDPASGLQSLFIPQTPFSFTYIPTVDYLNAVGGPNLVGADLLVTNAPDITAVAPEPASFLLLSGGLAAVLLRRRRHC